MNPKSPSLLEESSDNSTDKPILIDTFVDLTLSDIWCINVFSPVSVCRDSIESMNTLLGQLYTGAFSGTYHVRVLSKTYICCWDMDMDTGTQTSVGE